MMHHRLQLDTHIITECNEWQKPWTHPASHHSPPPINKQVLNWGCMGEQTTHRCRRMNQPRAQSCINTTASTDPPCNAETMKLTSVIAHSGVSLSKCVSAISCKLSPVSAHQIHSSDYCEHKSLLKPSGRHIYNQRK